MLRLRDIWHAYGEHESLRGVSLELGAGEIICLLGPSGCGKTTLLRIIAGLETASRGQLSMAGSDLSQVPAHKRNFGLMFQDFALFPHMTVADNIAYGLKRRGLASSLIKREVAQLLDRVGMSGAGHRDIASLSGGQKQRVALARSLAPKPRLLMLDEPLGSLDARLRDQLALELRQIIKEAGLSAIYVTHDHREAYAIADRIAVMNIGSIEQVDAPWDLYHQPRRAFVARFLGLRNIFAAQRDSLAGRLCREAEVDLRGAATVLIHPAGISVGAAAGQDLSAQGELREAVFRGDHYELRVALDAETSLRFNSPSLPAALGEDLSVRISREAIIPLAG